LALGEGIGRAINGWFANIDWKGLGNFFANNLNFFIDIATGFFDKFIQKAYENGQKLGEAFNAFVSQIHWDNLARAIYEGLNSLGQLIQGFVDMVDWETLKTNVNNTFKSIFENIDIEGIKKAVADLVNSIMDFLLSIDWYQIGYTVGAMLSGVDWLGVFKDVKDNIIWPALKGFWDGLMDDGKNALISSIGKIITWFKVTFLGQIISGIAGFLANAAMFAGITGLFKDGLGTSIASGLAGALNFAVKHLNKIFPDFIEKVRIPLQNLAYYFNGPAVELTDTIGGTFT